MPYLFIAAFSFNPLPSPKRGETTASSAASISSEFQSTPLAEARGDPKSPHICQRWTEFQSTPLAEARGDPRSFRCSSRLGVSIHSPRRSEGRL